MATIWQGGQRPIAVIVQTMLGIESYLFCVRLYALCGGNGQVYSRLGCDLRAHGRPKKPKGNSIVARHDLNGAANTMNLDSDGNRRDTPAVSKFVSSTIESYNPVEGPLVKC